MEIVQQLNDAKKELLELGRLWQDKEDLRRDLKACKQSHDYFRAAASSQRAELQT